jgi:hypothetical protein
VASLESSSRKDIPISFFFWHCCFSTAADDLWKGKERAFVQEKTKEAKHRLKKRKELEAGIGAFGKLKYGADWYLGT